MSYRIELKNCRIFLEDGFSGESTIDDASILNGDTTLLLDSAVHDLHDDATLVPVGARFTLAAAGDDIFAVTAQNSNKTWSFEIGADTTGTYTLTFNGQTTAAINGTDNAAAIQAALLLLSNVDAGDLVVTGAGPFVVEAAGQYEGLSSPVLTGTPTALDNFVAPAVVEPGAATWRITFTPALETGSLPTTGNAITWLPQQVELRIGEGNFEWTETDELIQDRDRGVLDGVRLGDEQPMEVTTAFVYRFLRASSGGAVTPYDAINRVGSAAGWHNASADPCEPYAITLKVVHTPPCGSEQSEVKTFTPFRKTSLNPNLEDAQISLSGQVAARRPTITRETL